MTKEENTRENAVSVAENAIDEKFKRLIVALTVGAVVLLSVLIVLMCYQLIKIGVENRRKAELNAKIAELQVLKEDGEKELEYLRTKDAIERLAYLYGLDYPDNIRADEVG